MPLNAQTLLSHGYLLKELPPVFTSVTLGQNFGGIALPPANAANQTKCVDFSIPKGRFSRRNLKIPHPFGYIHLVNHLVSPASQVIMDAHNTQCNTSMSFVRENNNIQNAISNDDRRAIINRYPTLQQAKKVAILSAFDKLFLVKIDISQYYPSIYTHTLPWALLGRDRAKQLYRMPNNIRQLEPDFPTYNFADELDRRVRLIQEGQSVGIPIGPDISHVISELIGSHFDQRLNARFPGLRAFRYFDDYEIYVDGEERAQEILRFAQEILAEFQLSINESKAVIKRFPFEFEEAWVREINSYPFDSNIANHIRQYFSMIFGLVEQFPEKTSTIAKYALRTFERRTSTITQSNWPLFQSLLLKTALIAPSCLDIVSRILETYRQFVVPATVASTIIRLLEQHSSLNHHFEIVWGLWILKQFNIQLSTQFVALIIAGGNPLCVLLLLDMEASGLIEGGQIAQNLKQGLSDALNNRDDAADWLLYYEAAMVKAWLPAAVRPEFNTLSVNNVTFYDQNAQIGIYPPAQ
jgi:hypothetical protein